MPYFLESDWAPRTPGSAGLGACPSNSWSHSAAEVTVAGAASSHLPRDGADVDAAAANTVAGTSGGSRIFE